MARINELIYRGLRGRPILPSDLGGIRSVLTRERRWFGAELSVSTLPLLKSPVFETLVV